MGGDRIILIDIPFDPLVADYTTCLMDACEVTKYLCGKAKTKNYKVIIIYLPLVLPLIKNCKIIEGPLEDLYVISYLIKLHLLVKLWVLSITESRFIRSDFKNSNVFEPLIPRHGDEKLTFNASPTFSLPLPRTDSLKDLGEA